MIDLPASPPPPHPGRGETARTQSATPGKKSTGTTFLQLSCDDFQRNPDGTWESTRQIDIDGPGGKQMIIPAGRKFDKGQMFVLGLDLAAVLQRQCG